MENERIMPSSVELAHESTTKEMDIACYLVKQSPTSMLVVKTLHEAWTSQKLSFRYLIFFHNDAYVHVPRENMSKLNDKAKKCIFIGYKHSIKGYNILNPIIKNTIYSRDVVFREVRTIPKQEAQPREE
jgi:hypothetical protein